MVNKVIKYGLILFATAAGLTGIPMLMWWLVELRYPFSIIVLDGDGFGDAKYEAGFTRITRTGDMFWWFYPTEHQGAHQRPLLLWLDGAAGLPPSLLANLAMIGPYDYNKNRRNGSWVEEYNLLFVDAPLGTGFSTVRRSKLLPSNLDENVEHLMFTLESFFSLHEEYERSPLYIVGQGDGAQTALALALKLSEFNSVARKKGVGGGRPVRPGGGSGGGSGGFGGSGGYGGTYWHGSMLYRSHTYRRRRNQVAQGEDLFSHNLQGVILGNPVIAPSLALTKLGFYLEEMGYVDARGRAAVEEFSDTSNSLVNSEEWREAFDHYFTLADVINEEAGAVAINLGRLVDKLTREPETTRDYFGKRNYLNDALNAGDLFDYMRQTVAPALGFSISSYDHRRDNAVQALRRTYMIPAVNLVEQILQTTSLKVSIYNGNLDATSPTPGQLEWVNNLRWTGQTAFLNSPRTTLVINGLVEGYFQGTGRLSFYWMNAAGIWVPMDSPLAMRRVMQLITGTTPIEPNTETTTAPATAMEPT